MKEYVVSPGRKGSHGPRIYIEDTLENATMHRVLTKESIWNGHDKTYEHAETGIKWLGYEMSSLEEHKERMKRAVVALKFAGYSEAGAEKVMQHFR